MSEQQAVKRGQIVEVEIEASGFQGRAVARLNGLVVFVRGAVPGDRVRAIVHKKRRRYLEAGLHELLEPSPHRVDPPCQHFGVCGGCRWQNLRYSRQIADKRQQVSDLLTRIGGLEVEVEETLAAPSAYYYRNKMEFSFGTSRWLTTEEISSGRPVDRSFALGLHVPGRFDKLVDLRECHLQSEASSQIVNRVRQLAIEQGWSAYDCRQHTGFLRHLVIRSSHSSGEMMVCLVTSRYDPDRMQVLKEMLLAEFEMVTTIVNTINSTLSDVSSGDEILIHGTGYLIEQLHGLRFQVSPSTFFQTNTAQAEALYRVVREMALTPRCALLFDVYTGVGSIALYLSQDAGQVVGFDENPGSIQSARENASLNRIENAAFHAADAAEALTESMLGTYGRPDVMVLDPPRAGLSSQMIRRILSSGCGRLVYVSCNPSTQARDIGLLKDSYRVARVRPVDMFPQTPHIESVALLLKRGESEPASPLDPQ